MDELSLQRDEYMQIPPAQLLAKVAESSDTMEV